MSHLPIQLIVGLCNPGSEYKNTRHNIGADVVAQIAAQADAHLKEEAKFKGLHTRIPVGTEYCHLLLPTTYMNNSGEAVKAIAQFYKIPVESILVVHDELDLPVGEARLKRDGGHGGHNGLRDIMQHLSATQFLRLRVGIGRPESSADMTNYVLTKPSTEERGRLDTVMQDIFHIMPDLLSGHIQQAMKVLNTKRETNNGI